MTMQPAPDEDRAHVLDLQAYRERKCAATPPGHKMQTQLDATTGHKVATCRKCGLVLAVNR